MKRSFMLSDNQKNVINESYDKMREAMLDRYEHDLNLYTKCEEMLKQLPVGTLSNKNINNKRRTYYQYISNDDSGKKFRQRYLGKKDNELYMQLCQRRFILECLPILESNMKTLSKAIEDFQVFDPTTIWMNLPDIYQKGKTLSIRRININDDYYFNNSDEHIKADLNSTNKSIMRPEGLKHVTIKGNRVRSKSEAIIANELEMHEIFYQYEKCLSINEHHYIPDFTIPRARDKRIIYWEHFGMLNDAQYVEAMDKKLRDYRSVGIVPWHNLITTYDLPDGSIDVQDIDRIIKAFIIR